MAGIISGAQGVLLTCWVEDKIPFEFHSKYDATYIWGEQKYIDEVLIFIFFSFTLNFYILNWVRIEN